MTNEDGWKSLDVIGLEIFGSKRTRDDVGCSSLCALPVSYPLQASGFGQLPAGGSSFSLPPASSGFGQLPAGGSSFSLTPCKQWLRPTASRGFFFLSYPLQAVASANCQQGGASAGSADPPFFSL
ncbi:hypothetical protein ACQ4LE_000323 [Meloidogyne hapla]